MKVEILKVERKHPAGAISLGPSYYELSMVSRIGSDAAYRHGKKIVVDIPDQYKPTKNNHGNVMLSISNSVFSSMHLSTVLTSDDHGEPAIRYSNRTGKVVIEPLKIVRSK